MISKRIKLISSLINNNDYVLDIGTDHALLPIYLQKNNIVSIADGSDISANVCENAKKNVKKSKLDNIINIYLSDGINNINIDKYNTFVIAGMGFNTIKNILENKKVNNINKMIIQTNNDYPKMRQFLNKINYKIIKELCIKEKNINYIIFLLEKGKQKLNKEEYLCGIYNQNNIWYYKEKIKKLSELLNKIPLSSNKKVVEIEEIISIYNKYLIKEKIED